MDFLTILEKLSVGDVVGAILILLSFIQITPVKVNPWSFIAKHLGRAINKEVMEKMEMSNKEVMAEMQVVKSDLTGVHKELDDIREREEIKDMDAIRNRILRFADELRQHIHHSKEYFDQVLSEIDTYLEFCRSHDNYPNSKADAAIKYTLECYEKVLKEDSFV